MEAIGSMRKSVMERMMDGLVRKMSVVFGRPEEEVSEAVNAEMKEMLEEYKTWAKAMTTVAASKKVPKEKVQKEKVPKVPKEPKEKAAKVPKAKKAAAASASAAVVAEDDEVVIESTAAAVVVIESAATGGETEVTTKVPKAKAPKVPKAKVEKVPKEKAPKAEKVPKEKAPKAPKAAKAKEVVVVPEAVVEVPEAEEEEEVEVVEMEYQGVKYLRSGKGVVYDAETSEEVGMWNEETQSIEVE